MPNARPITRERKRQMIDELRRGESDAVVADRYGLAIRTVKQYRNAYGLKPSNGEVRKRRNPHDPDDGAYLPTAEEIERECAILRGIHYAERARSTVVDNDEPRWGGREYSYCNGYFRG